MKTLAKYLAEYINYVVGDDNVLPDDLDVLKEWIIDGIDAYQSTENCTVKIKENKPVIACDGCRKCGTTVCGNDPTFRCFEPKQ